MEEQLTIEQITEMQKHYGLTEIQSQINSGLCWKLEGSVGRGAMDLLTSGACMLPLETRIDFYGNKVPSRDVLKAGTKGTFENSQRFWKMVDDGDIDLYGYDEEESEVEEEI